MRGMKKTLLPLLLLSVAVLFAACGGSEDTTTTDAAATTSSSVIGGGEATCDETTFAGIIAGIAEQDGTSATLDGYECADGWALVTVSDADAADEQTTTTYVFQAQGPNWALQSDLTGVCDNLPETLKSKACNTDGVFIG
jgi:hypothetical protein